MSFVERFMHTLIIYGVSRTLDLTIEKKKFFTVKTRNTQT